MNPYNQEAEQGLLGCIFLDNSVFDQIALITEEAHFYVPVHGRIFAAIKTALAKNIVASPVQLANQFQNDPDLENLGGSSYLADLAACVFSAFNATDYAETIKDLWQRRELLKAATFIKEKAMDFKLENRGKALEEAEKIITDLGNHRSSTTYTAGQAVEKARKWMKAVRQGNIQQYHTGLDSLDKKIGGLFAGRLYILGARPGMGKTALALNIADHISINSPVLFMSLEMPAEEIGMRLEASRTGISVGKMQGTEDFDMVEIQALQESLRDIVTRNLYIEDSSGITIHGIKSLARRHKRQHGKFVFFIDYLGLITPDHEIKNKVHQIEDITTNLKRLAKELEIPIVLLCQLSRGLEGREDKRPALADLRDSGSIEQDADVVMFIYRPEYYDSGIKPVRSKKETEEKFQERMAAWERNYYANKGKAEIIIAKNRQGTAGTVTINFNGKSQKFYEQ